MRTRLSNWFQLNARTALIVGAFAALPLFLHAGFLNTRGGGDSPFLLFRLHQLLTALGAGQFPARWMPDAAYGLGYPFFHYYAALSFYVAAAFKLLGFSYVLALKLTQLAGFLAAAAGMYGWIRAASGSRPAAWLAAAAYTFAPFHMVNVYVRGDSLAEFWAMALFPLCLWAAHALTERATLARVAAFAASYGALVFTHNVSALIFTPFLLLYLAARSGRKLLPGVVGLAGGLALAAFFWVPALLEQDFAQLAPVTEGYFHYANHFRAIDLLQTTLLFNYNVGSPDTTPFAMGILQAALTVLGLLALLLQVVVQRRNVRHALFLGIGLFVSTFMITPLSRVLWDHAPLLSFVQFPWRFLSVQALFTAAITGALLHSWRAAPRDREEPPSSAPPSSLFIVPVFIAVLLLGAAALANLRLDFVPVADADVSAKSLQEYEYFTGNIGTTVNYEYLPVWTQPRPYTSEELLRGTVTARAVQGELASAVRVEKTADSQVWEIDVRSESAAVAVPLLYWPGWRATIDGEAADVRPLPGMGWTLLDLPRGIHTVRLQLGSTPVRAAAGAASLLAAGFVALGLITALPAITARIGQALPSGRSAVIALVGLAILVVALRVITPRLRTHGPATMDFAQLGWLQRTPVHFENGAVLRGYNYSSDQAARGELFAVKMVWEGAGRPFVLELVGPGENLLRVAATHARVEGATAPEADLLLTLPADIPPGVYFLRLRMTDGSAALTPTGRPRGDVYLRPLRLDDPGLEAPAAPVAALLPGLDLAALEVQPADASAVTVAPVWRAAGPFNVRAAIALRLRAPDGRLLAELDTQAGSAVYPTDLWRPGEAVPDPYTLALPAGLPPGEYPLTLRLYDAQTLEALAEVVAPVTLSAWTPRPAAPPFAALSDWLALQSLAAPGVAVAGQSLALEPAWSTLAAPPLDARAEWTLAAGDQSVAAITELAPGLPLSTWPPDVLVAQPAHIELPPDLRAGAYTLTLRLVDGEGNGLGDAVEVGAVTVVNAASISTQPPPTQYEADAAFGPIRLVGYDAALTEEALQLTLVWQADSAPDASYKYFAHLFDPVTEAIVAQADAFPQGGAHPTSEWLPGEVVSEAVSLPLAEVAAGGYNIAVGWYDPETGARAPAAGSDGASLPQDRFVLSVAVEIP